MRYDGENIHGVPVMPTPPTAGPFLDASATI